MSEDNDSAKYQISVGRSVICLGKIKDPTTAVGQMPATDECLRRVQARIGTMLKIDNVSFLLGAGASMHVGGVTFGGFPISIERDLVEAATREQDGQGKQPSHSWLPLFYETLSLVTGLSCLCEERCQALRTPGSKEPPRIQVNFEEYLSQLHAWSAGMTSGVEMLKLGTKEEGKEELVVRRDSLDALIKHITRSLVNQLDLPKKMEGESDPLRVHKKFLKKILTRPLNLRRADIFTLNYDTLLEQAADAEGIMLVDGFVGTLHRSFRPECYDMDFYFPGQTTEGRVHRYDRAAHLYKLHGSTSWHRSEEDGHLFATSEKNPDDVVIFPTGAKYGQTLAMPYAELFRRFASTVAQPQSILFAIGYGFGDEHVNTLIRQALSIPSFTLVIVDPEPKSDFVSALRQHQDERTWLVTGSLGRFQSFVDCVLPDLHEEDIERKIEQTLRDLDSSTKRESENSETTSNEQ